MTTNSLPENESTGAITLPKTSEIEAIYESIEQNAREQYKPQLLPKISPRLTMLVLAAVGVVGALIGSADLKVDTTVTFDTKLGQRTQPHWLVPKGAKVVKTDTGAGAIKGIGWLIGSLSGAALWHVAGNDERWQRFVGTLQSQWVEDYFKRNRAMAELQSMAALQMEKQRLDKEVNIDLAEQTWQFHQAIGYDPLVAQAAQNALPYGVPGTYDDVNDPRDKVTDSTSPAIKPEDSASPNKYAYIKGFLSSTCLAWGNQGGGKSWLVRYLAREKVRLGYRVIVFDPNSNRTAWEGLELYNTYAEIERMMRWYVTEVTRRYEEFCASTITEEEWRAQLWKDGLATSVICEEATTYADFIKDEELLSSFFRCGATLSRKPEMPLTIVAHNNTQWCLGNVKGLGNLIRRMQQIQLIATTDKSGKTSQPIASGRALIKMDGSEEWVEVEVPKIEAKITKFKSSSDSNSAPTAPTTAPDSTDTAPTLTPSLDKASSDSHQPHHPIPQGWKMANPADITLVVRGVIVACIRAGWSQTKTIQEVFGIAKSGNNPNYDLAREVFQQISNSIN